jgi:uncharacterized protein with LGFP repeats
MVRLSLLRRYAGAIVALFALSQGGPAAAAAPDTALASGEACGYALSAPILNKWNAMGGPQGALGCPQTRETPTLPSPQGSQGREATFGRGEGGAILWHASGPRAGQTFAVMGCVWRLYFQFGGPGGWLGLPTSDAVNTPDGKNQTFEGGSIAYARALDACSATHASDEQTASASPPASPTAASKAPLDLFFDPARGDYLTTASESGAARALAAHYQRVRTEGFVFTTHEPGTVALKLYWNETLGDNDTVATPEGERDALAAGYTFGGLQGYVYSDPSPGAKPLKLFYNPGTHDTLLTATAEGETDAASKGYAFVRIEGYVPAAP